MALVTSTAMHRAVSGAPSTFTELVFERQDAWATSSAMPRLPFRTAGTSMAGREVRATILIQLPSAAAQRLG